MKTNADNLISTVWNQPHLITSFDKKTGVCKYNVEAIFLQISGASMVSVEVIAPELVLVIRNEEHDGPFKSKAYKVDVNWHGINITDETKKRQHTIHKIKRNTEKSSAITEDGSGENFDVLLICCVSDSNGTLVGTSHLTSRLMNSKKIPDAKLVW